MNVKISPSKTVESRVTNQLGLFARNISTVNPECLFGCARPNFSRFGLEFHSLWVLLLFLRLIFTVSVS